MQKHKNQVRKYLVIYSFTFTFFKVFLELMYLILPKRGLSGPQALSYLPSTQKIPL